jgi:methanethiol S-methyltransferase
MVTPVTLEHPTSGDSTPTKMNSETHAEPSPTPQGAQQHGCRRPGPVRGFMILAYGLVAYAWFLVTLLYLIGFLANLGVPRSIDGPAVLAPHWAIPANLLLLVLFGVQHSVMARPGFKRWWTTIIPRSLERSTFVLITNGIFASLFVFWQPLPSTMWQISGGPLVAVVWALFGVGLTVALVSTFLIDHFELFGVRQVWAAARGRTHHPPHFHVRGFYRYARHPLMFGFLLAFWATPHMTLGRLLFCGVMTIYILIALQLEERDLVHFHGDAYRDYQRRVPMLFPTPGRAWSNSAPEQT